MVGVVVMKFRTIRIKKYDDSGYTYHFEGYPKGHEYLVARGFSADQIAWIMSFYDRYQKLKRFTAKTNFNRFMRAVPRYHRGGLHS
jgi:hypothetical protein